MPLPLRTVASLTGCSAVGGALAGLLAAPGLRPWLSENALDASACLWAGQIAALSLALGVLTRLRFAGAAWTQRRWFFTLLASLFGVTLASRWVGDLALDGARALLDSAAAVDFQSAPRALDSGLLALLGSSLFLAGHERRTLSIVLIGAAWVLPALLAGPGVAPAGANPSAPSDPMLSMSWPLAAAGAALAAAMLALRPITDEE